MRDKKKQQQWIKEHYDTIKGFRPLCHFEALSNDMCNRINLGPNDFLYGRIKQPLRIYGKPTLGVHVPRSLLKRAKIQVDKVTRQIKGTSAMHSANK